MMRWKSFIILLSISYSAKSIHLFLTETYSESDVNEIPRCLLQIVEENNLLKPIFSIYETNQNKSSNTSSFTPIEVKLVDTFFQNNIPIISLSNNSDNILKAKKVYNEHLIIIIYIETCETLLDLTNGIIEKDIKYIIIIKEDITFRCNEPILETAKRLSIYDVTFMYKDKEENLFKIFTCIPTIDAITCKLNENIKLSTFRACRNRSMINDKFDLFPSKKPSNWMSCPLNVGMGSLRPFVKSKKSLQNLEPLNGLEGSDVEILKIIAEYYNASLSLYNIKVVSENILLDVSFLAYLLNGTLEVCAGGLYRVFGDTVSYSGIYSREEVVWIYTVERQSGSWLTFIEKIDGLYIFIFFYLSYGVIWNIFGVFDEHKTSAKIFVIAWGALVGADGLQDARTLKSKILNLFYSLLCLHLSAYVSTQLYYFLTIQKPPYVFKNTDDIAKSGRPLFLKDGAKYFIDDENYVALANTSNDCDGFKDCVAKTLTYEGVTVILDGIFSKVQTDTTVGGEARILKSTEAILVVYHEMLIWKGSYLVGTFDKVLNRLFETGICKKLYDESVGILVIDKARRANQKMMSDSYRCMIGCTITLTQCIGAFYVWIIGCILSFCVFCVEILIHKHRRKLN